MQFYHTSMTQKPSSLQSCFTQVKAHQWNSRNPEILPNRWSQSSSLNPVMWPQTPPGEENSQCQVVHQHLCAQGLRGLEFTPSKQQQLWPAAPAWQCKCPHRRHYSGLPRGKLCSAGHPDHMFPRLIPLWFLLIPSSSSWRGSSFRVSKMHELFLSHDFWHASVWSGAMVVWFERLTKCVHADGAYFEKLN